MGWYDAIDFSKEKILIEKVFLRTFFDT